jgi:hypothetical protein
MDSHLWEEDWRIMSLPGRLAMHRALVLDCRNHCGDSLPLRTTSNGHSLAR